MLYDELTLALASLNLKVLLLSVKTIEYTEAVSGSSPTSRINNQNSLRQEILRITTSMANYNTELLDLKTTLVAANKHVNDIQALIK